LYYRFQERICFVISFTFFRQFSTEYAQYKQSRNRTTVYDYHCNNKVHGTYKKCERDNETDAFLKTMPKIRILLDRENRMRTVKQIEKLHTVRKHIARKDTATFGQSIMPLLALPITLAGNGGSDIHTIDSTAPPGFQITLTGNSSSEINEIDNKAPPGLDFGFQTSTEIFAPQNTIKMLEHSILPIQKNPYFRHRFQERICFVISFTFFRQFSTEYAQYKQSRNRTTGGYTGKSPERT
jgi:hypothetical protein